MDGATETLLLLLITLLSGLAIAGLVMLVIVLIAINRLMKKIQLASDVAVGTMAAFKNKFVKFVGLFGVARNLFKLVKRK